MKSRKIKLFISLVVCVACALSMSPIVKASSYSTGKAVIPYFYQNSTSVSFYTVSNITDNNINVTVTFYDSNGTLLTDDNSATTGRISGTPELMNYNEQNTASSLTFTLSAHSTGVITINNNSVAKYGYGVMQWTQDSNSLQGLVAWGEIINNKTGYATSTSIDINSGLPF